MPVTLVVLPKNAELGKILPMAAEHAVTFDGTRIVLGRGPSADLALPDASVSLRHASIRTSGADYVLLDEGSTNGTFHGDTRLTPHVPRTLKSGDRIGLGRLRLEVRIGAAPVTRDLASTTLELALALVAEMLEAGGGDTSARVSVEGGADAGATARLSQEGRHYIVGRGDGCDLLLNDPDCSREHVIFLRKGAHTFVVDLGSKNGSYLGSQRLTPHVETRVSSGRTVQAGRTLLVVEEPAALALHGLESASDEVLSELEAASAAQPTSDALPPSRGPDIAPRSSAEIVEVPRSGFETAPKSSKAPASSATASQRDPEGPRTRGPASRSPRGIGVADVVVILVALSLIGFSIAGLYWLIGPGK